MSRFGLAIGTVIVELGGLLSMGQVGRIVENTVKGLQAKQQNLPSAAEAAKPAEAPPLVASHTNALDLTAAGRRDPFLSPVVNRSMTTSNCAGGRHCLAADQVNLRGIVSSTAGMIAIVVNTAGKAYFLREKDLVLRGYVKRITEDSIVFSETVPDKLGKPVTHEVIRKLSVTPSV
jgi:Tfp pilus assembly protein PilP